MSTQSQVNDLLQVTSRLVTVLEREVQLLRTVPSTELEALQEEKSALTAPMSPRPGLWPDIPSCLRRCNRCCVPNSNR